MSSAIIQFEPAREVDSGRLVSWSSNEVIGERWCCWEGIWGNV